MRMNQPLFVESPKISFPKVKHASAQLSEDHNKWSSEILNQLFKDVPEASEYTPTVSMLQANEEQGYAIGIIIIKSRPDTAMSVDEPAGGSSGVRQAVVPFFIKNFMLLPLDILIADKGRMTPLTPERLREALFKPQTFSLMTKDWGDQSLYNIFYPPGRGSNDFASGTSSSAGGSGGANYIMGPGMKFSMLDTIAQSIAEKDLEKVSSAFVEEPALLDVMRENPLFAGAVEKLASLEGTLMDGGEVFDAAMSAVAPDVVQMGYSANLGRYWVKTANRRFFWNANPEYLTRREMIEKVGEDVTAKVDTEGTVTLSDVEDEPLLKEDDSSWEIVERSGIYKVVTMKGKELVGWVIPSLVDFDGHSVPMTIFTNGGMASVQGEVLGSPVSLGVNLPNEDPSGTGVFYVAGENGITATVPVSVMGTEEAMDGSTVILVKTLTGGSYKLKQVEGLKAMVPAKEDGDYVMVPDSIKFMSLNQETAVELASTPSDMKKTASALAMSRVALYGDGIRYGATFTNAPHLETTLSKHADLDDTVFTLCLAGYTAGTAHKLAKEAQYGRVEVPVDDIRMAASVVSPILEKAKESASECASLRQHLVKEAAMLPDIQTVDSVLSLSFINPENVRTFISRLPYLEKSLSHICELVLAARMGLTEIPEFASARAARGLDETIQGLKALGMREIDEADR